MRVLGIDPGFERLGWGIVDRDNNEFVLIACGCIRTSKDEKHSARLKNIQDELNTVILAYNPNLAVVEDLFFSTNAKTAIAVAQARGVILLTCQVRGLIVSEPTPLQIKSAVTGNGKADKKAVEKMVRLTIKNLPEKLLDDTLDALAAAIS